jgi:hypothetical protein
MPTICLSSATAISTADSTTVSPLGASINSTALEVSDFAAAATAIPVSCFEGAIDTALVFVFESFGFLGVAG